MPRPSDSLWELFDKLKIHPTWGYVIYRTTYLSESNAQFSTVIKYLEVCIKKSVFAEAAECANESTGVDPAIYEGNTPYCYRRCDAVRRCIN